MLPIKFWQTKKKATLAIFMPLTVLITGCDRDALFEQIQRFSGSAEQLESKFSLEEIEGATQKLGDAIAKLEQTNAMLGKLALGINFVVSILETLAGGGVVSIAGAISELDNFLE